MTSTKFRTLADKLNAQKAEFDASAARQSGYRYKVDAGKLASLRLEVREGHRVAASLDVALQAGPLTEEAVRAIVEDATVVDRVFRWSTPAPNIDGTVPMPWRVVDIDIFKAHLETYQDLGRTWCEHDGRGILVGMRDERDAPVRHAKMVELAQRLRRDGFRVLLDDTQVDGVWLRVRDRHEG